MTIRIIKHEAVPQTGSFEVRFPDGRAAGTEAPAIGCEGDIRADEGQAQMNELKPSLPWLAAALLAVGVIGWVVLTFPL